MSRPIYASFNDFKGRVRIETLKESLDFARDGSALEDVFRTAIAEPSCADIDRQLGGVFPGFVPFPDIGDDPPTPGDIKELALDWYTWRLHTMYPTRMSIDVAPLWAKIQSDLKRLREGRDVINQKPPSPARNVGGRTGAIGDSPPCLIPPTNFEDMGSYG